jgi:hypothetical protein
MVVVPVEVRWRSVPRPASEGCSLQKPLLASEAPVVLVTHAPSLVGWLGEAAASPALCFVAVDPAREPSGAPLLQPAEAGEDGDEDL